MQVSPGGTIEVLSYSMPKKKAASIFGSGLFSEFRKISVRSGGLSDHVHAAAFLVELHAAVDEGEERVVTADADTETWMHLRSALADEDVTGDDGLAAELFHAEALAAGIATVFNGALSFFMGHKSRLVKG